MFRDSLRGGVEWALMAALVLGAGAIAQAQNDERADGKVVKIGRADGDAAKPDLPPPNDGAGIPVPTPRVPMPKYWIGLLGGSITPDNPLRAHLDLPENQGLIVANVVPDGPAAKAGLKQHDILLRANDTDLHEMQDLGRACTFGRSEEGSDHAGSSAPQQARDRVSHPGRAARQCARAAS